VQNITGLPPALLPSGGSTSQALALSVVVAQSLLYFSLFATLLAALLAVLGKQWLLHYNSVGERGTIAERGAERQRKFDGMCRWRFNLVMQAFPLLLQFSLLLFATALSIYLWTIHHTIAAIALTLTGLGSLLYAVMVISAVLSPDSPFQTSLSFLLKTVLEQFSVPEHWYQSFLNHWTHLALPLRQMQAVLLQCWSTCSGAVTRIAPLLPVFHTSELLEAVPIFAPPDPPSTEVTAVVWMLETSTDPGLAETAAEVIPELQWPLNLDFRSALKRLDDTFGSCIERQWHVRTGMTNRATICIRAFWVLDMVTQEGQRTPDLWTYQFASVENSSEDLSSIEFWVRRPFDPTYSVEPVTMWSLPLIAANSLPEKELETFLENFDLISSGSKIDDKLVYADFLFCVISFFRPTTARDCSVRDKT
jgi:hypothetical protein